MIATAHLTEEQFQQYKNRRISLPELFAIGDHLAECRECREKLDCTEERAAILEALTRNLQSVLLKGSQDLTYNEPAGFAPPDPPQPVTPMPSQKRLVTFLPLVIGIVVILLLFGLLIAISVTNLL
jgi:hypothetical protein